MKFDALSLGYVLFARAADGSGGGGAPFVDARAGAEQIERSFVGTSATKGYTDQLVRFILHLFDNDRELINSSVLPQMELYDANDARKHSESRSRGGNKRAELRAFIKRSINEIKPLRDNQPHNCPINIDGDGSILTYDVIRDYMQGSSIRRELSEIQ
jgi:hypothetical protein